MQYSILVRDYLNGYVPCLTPMILEHYREECKINDRGEKKGGGEGLIAEVNIHLS